MCSRKCRRRSPPLLASSSAAKRRCAGRGWPGGADEEDECRRCGASCDYFRNETLPAGSGASWSQNAYRGRRRSTCRCRRSAHMQWRAWRPRLRRLLSYAANEEKRLCAVKREASKNLTALRAEAWGDDAFSIP